jgi:hypothetical protein
MTSTLVAERDGVGEQLVEVGRTRSARVLGEGERRGDHRPNRLDLVAGCHVNGVAFEMTFAGRDLLIFGSRCS